MKQALGSVVLGVVCFAIVAALVSCKAGESQVWAAWLLTTGGAAALAGYCWPAHPFRSALLIMAAQPPCLLVAVALAGEITNPGSSTGGLVAVGICTMLLFLWKPAPLVFSWFAARARRRADAGAQGARGAQP